MSLARPSSLISYHGRYVIQKIQRNDDVAGYSFCFTNLTLYALTLRHQKINCYPAEERSNRANQKYDKNCLGLFSASVCFRNGYSISVSADFM